MKALYAGSFDPFTTGHKSIVDRALSIFPDGIVIGVGVNPGKAAMLPAEERVEAIRRIYAAEPRVSVEAFEGLTAEFAASRGIGALLRGVRSVADFEYERNMADINRTLLPGRELETVILPALPELAAVSSSVVRELARFGADYSRFIPNPDM